MPDTRDYTLPALTRDDAAILLDQLEDLYLERFGHRFRHDYAGDVGGHDPVAPDHPEFEPLGALLERLHDHLAGQLCEESLARSLAPYGGDHQREVERRQAEGREAK